MYKSSITSIPDFPKKTRKKGSILVKAKKFIFVPGIGEQPITSGQNRKSVGESKKYPTFGNTYAGPKINTFMISGSNYKSLIWHHL